MKVNENIRSFSKHNEQREKKNYNNQGERKKVK